MQIDLFEFLESIFRGLVYFFYNAVETLWILTVHPWRGPAWLYRTYTQKDRKQIGGLTFLFLILFLFFGLCARMFSVTEFRLQEVLGKPLALGSDETWRTVVSAAASTVLLDSISRLYFRWRVPYNVRRRRRLLAMFEYSLAWPVLLMALLPFGALTAAGTKIPDNAAIAVMFSIPFAMLLSLIAAAPASAGLRMQPPVRTRKGQHHKWSRRASATLTGGIQLGITLVVASAILSGGFLMIMLTASESPSHVPGRLDPIALRCRFALGQLQAVAVLQNNTDLPVLLEPVSDTVLEVGSWDGALDRALAVRPADNQPEEVVVQPHQSQMLRVIAAVDPGKPTLERGNFCSLERSGRGAVAIGPFDEQTIDFGDL